MSWITVAKDAVYWGWGLIPDPKAAIVTAGGALVARIWGRKEEPVKESPKQLEIMAHALADIETERRRVREELEKRIHTLILQRRCLAVAAGGFCAMSIYLASTHDCR